MLVGRAIGYNRHKTAIGKVYVLYRPLGGFEALTKRKIYRLEMWREQAQIVSVSAERTLLTNRPDALGMPSPHWREHEASRIRLSHREQHPTAPAF
jgi:hypothetical protein